MSDAPFSPSPALAATFATPDDERIGLGSGAPHLLEPQLRRYINLKLAAMGLPLVKTNGESELEGMTRLLLARQQQSHRLLADYLCPADQRIQTFLYDYFQEIPVAKLPGRTFVLDRHGLARVLSLPAGSDHFSSEIIDSYRVKQGVLHNPRSDRRTTAGIFHVTEGGLPIPADKLAAPMRTFAHLLSKALDPPPSLMTLPYTAGQSEPAKCFVSLLLRPRICPDVPGAISGKSMEIRFFAPGNLVSNLDFVESIFGNAGDPFLPENDAGLDSDNWSGHTGCVILAPHLVGITRKEAGLPHVSEATERQVRDGMCWERETELYNEGRAFKLTARDSSGVIVTLIADNYFGYCKKEVKTQISFASNLFGQCEEEHAGGALVFPSYDLGEEFSGHLHVPRLAHNFKSTITTLGSIMQIQPEGYGIDKNYPDILYVPEDVLFDLHGQTVSWKVNGEPRCIRLLPGKTYVRPSGYKVHMIKPPGGRAWRLVGTVAEGTYCHKPCTVSGGGKSEISKPISDAILEGPVYVKDFKADFDAVEKIINRDFTGRFRAGRGNERGRKIFSPERSLGSVIRLLTPSPEEYTDGYSAWLETVPQYIRELVFVVKRFYKPEWAGNWREHFSVDIIDGVPAHELRCDRRKLVSTYLRVGFDADGAWRTFGLRKDFQPSVKIAGEDDITVSTVVPMEALHGLNPEYDHACVKFVANCEYRLFQRPDDAIHRGYDKLTEQDFSRDGNFFSNYAPLEPPAAVQMVEDAIRFGEFTESMQSMVRHIVDGDNCSYFVCSDSPRIVDGKPSKNPRYLQIRPDLQNPKSRYLAEVGTRLKRGVPLDRPLHLPVNAVLPGRRNNPREQSVRAMAVFNPIHYLELPELFMEFICSMTGKSPSTTGAGSEGALTKGPFNALPPIIDLNSALVSHLLTQDPVFITAAGYVGPNARVDHDISLLVPEVWCRMSVEERNPLNLFASGCLEKCTDFEFNGRIIQASRLGYRITELFVSRYFGRVFNHPDRVFTPEMLRPELQGMETFVEGMDTILSTQKRVAELYFDDGSIHEACPPLQALLHIMLHDEYKGMHLDDPKIRAMFSRESLLESDWYRARLEAKRRVDRSLARRHIRTLESFLSKPTYSEEAARLGITDRLLRAYERRDAADSEDYLQKLQGTLGVHALNC